MFHTSHIQISKSALHNNVQFLKNMLGSKTRLSSVIKGNAYGHGIDLFVPMAEECGVDHFSVFSANEALTVYDRKLGDTTLMIMGMIDNDEIQWAVERDVEFYVFELDRLKHAIETAKKCGKPANIHIEVETGMNRTGFSPLDLKHVVELLAENKQFVNIKGVCTHYAGAESISNYVRVKRQIQNFRKVSNFLVQHGVKPELKHTACSAASIAYPQTRMDMARIGIMQYGFWPSRETFIHYLNDHKTTQDPLQRVLSWKSSIMSVKEVKSGEFIGYGTSYMAEQDMKIATVAVGYSHGYSRSLSNQGRVLVRGQRLSVIGMVNMNMLLLDCTGLDNVEKGDEVVLIGKQGDMELSVHSFGEMSKMLNYELLTRLPHDIPRRVVE